MTKQHSVTAVALDASHRSEAPGKRLRDVHGNKVLDVSVQLPMAGTAQNLARALQTPGRLNARQLRRLIGAKPGHVSKLSAAARAAGLTVLPRTASDKQYGIVRLSGRYAQFQTFFPELDLGVYKIDKKGDEVIGRVGSIKVQDGLNIVGVYGFDDREVAHTNFRIHKGGKGTKKHDDSGSFPTGLTARGQARLTGVPVDDYTNQTGLVTGYLSLGGDNGKKMWKDLDLAAAHDGITLNKGGMIGVNVDGTKLDGDYTDESTVENILDALQHRLNNPNGTCAVFVGGNNDDSFARAAETATAWAGVKTSKGTNPLRALTISWGMAEANNTPQTLQRWARIYLAARLKGLVITAATGDNGATDNTSSDTPDAPSSTTDGFGAAGLYVKVGADGKTIVEIGVWNDIAAGGGATGGGISATFAVQPYEKVFNLPVSGSTGKPGHNAATLADIAAPASGPLVWWKGQSFPVGGTSNAAPAIGIKLALIQHQLKNPITDMIAFVFENYAAITTRPTVAGDNGEPTYKSGPDIAYSVSTGFGLINFPAFLAVAKKQQDGIGA